MVRTISRGPKRQLFSLGAVFSVNQEGTRDGQEKGIHLAEKGSRCPFFPDMASTAIMATSWRIDYSNSREASAKAMAPPAEGPSFGVDPPIN
jgi:hypothetical protein